MDSNPPGWVKKCKLFWVTSSIIVSSPYLQLKNLNSRGQKLLETLWFLEDSTLQDIRPHIVPLDHHHKTGHHESDMYIIYIYYKYRKIYISFIYPCTVIPPNNDMKSHRKFCNPRLGWVWLAAWGRASPRLLGRPRALNQAV